MKISLKGVFSGILLLLASALVLAGEDPLDLGACLVDNTTGKDRKALAKWTFIAMSAHPAVQQYSKASDADEVEIQKAYAELVMRLLTDSCREQAKIAFQKNGARAFEGAFELLGGVAMQELMAHPDVEKSTAAFVGYMDLAKLNSVLSPN